MEKTITIFGDINKAWWGDGSKEKLWNELDEAGIEQTNIVVSSDGGSLFEGFAMCDFIKGMKSQTTTYGTGLIASAATFPFLAADKVYMTPHSAMMIHNAQGGAYGDANELMHVAGITGKADDIIAAFYAKRSKLPTKTIREYMNAETWFTPEEALKLGFIDGIKELPKGIRVPNEVKNHIGTKPLPKKIQNVLNQNSNPMLKTITDFINKHFQLKDESQDVSNLAEDFVKLVGNEAVVEVKNELTTIQANGEKVSAALISIENRLKELEAKIEFNDTAIKNMQTEAEASKKTIADVITNIANLRTAIPAAGSSQQINVSVSKEDEAWVKKQMGL